MEKKTVGMIRYLKHHGGEYPSYREAAIAYMMKYSGCDRKVYTDGVIEGIIFEVFCDFIDHADKPSMQLRQMQESARIASYGAFKTNVYDYMLTAMVLCEVRGDNGEYRNGFRAEDFQNNPDVNTEEEKVIKKTDPNLHKVYFFGNQGAEDLFKEPSTGRVYVRQPASQKENGRYTRIVWLTSCKWSGGYEASVPLTKATFEIISRKDSAAVLYREKGEGESVFPFSYEAYKEIAEEYRNDLRSYDEWHKWITENKPEKINTDTWIYGNTTYLEDPDIIPNGNYLGNDLFVERNVIRHNPTGKEYAVYELTSGDDIVLEICGYEYPLKEDKQNV